MNSRVKPDYVGWVRKVYAEITGVSTEMQEQFKKSHEACQKVDAAIEEALRFRPKSDGKDHK